MSRRIQALLSRHPLLRDALLWAVPALLIGGALRLLLISYLPYAFWGADSRSHFSFAHLLLVKHNISLDEKRRYLYPILMLPVSLLPGATLRWLPILQHALGLVSLAPLAYLIRKTLAAWRIWIVPVTVFYSLIPVIILFEHELVSECLFFNAFLWAYAGWSAWLGEARAERRRRLFWWFFIPFAAFILTKAAGRFVWPGLFVGLFLAWRAGRLALGRPQIVALILLAVITPTVGSKKQGAWLLYTAVFPLTQLDTPLHADYKAEIRDTVEPLHAQIDTYYLQDDVPFEFLQHPDRKPIHPLWAPLEHEDAVRTKLYMDLALEAIKAHPGTFLYLGLQRLVGSVNLSRFNHLDAFGGDYYRDTEEHFYAEAERDEKSPLRLAFGLPKHGPVPPYAEFQNRLDPAPHSWAAQIVPTILERVTKSIDFLHMPVGPVPERIIWRARPTMFGWLLLLGAVVAFLPAYRLTHGVWTLSAVSYLGGVFIVSQTNPRYLAATWPVLLILVALPGDALFRWLAGRIAKKQIA